LKHRSLNGVAEGSVVIVVVVVVVIVVNVAVDTDALMIDVEFGRRNDDELGTFSLLVES
jgi:hypothetical protein